MLGENVWLHIRRYGNEKAMAAILGISSTTIKAKKTNPSKFTLAEIRKLQNALNIPLDEIERAIHDDFCRQDN